MVLNILLWPSPQVPCPYLLSKAYLRQLQFLFLALMFSDGEKGEIFLSFTLEAAVDTLGHWGPYHYGALLSIWY